MNDMQFIWLILSILFSPILMIELYYYRVKDVYFEFSD